MTALLRLDTAELQRDVESTAPGQIVELSVLMKSVPTDQQIQDLSRALHDSGVEIVSPPAAAGIEWDGNEVPTIDLAFKSPVRADPGKTAFIPMLIVGVIAALGFGYVLWKGGEIAQTTMATLTKLAFPALLVLSAVWLASKYAPGRD